MAFTLADDNKYNELILAARVKGDQALVTRYEQARGMNIPPNEVTSALAPKTQLTPDQQSYDQLLRMRDELGLDVNETDKAIMLDRANGIQYNPTTGSYSVKNQGGTGMQSYAFGYDPNQNKSSIYGTQIAGALDPRIALGMTEEDYTAADKWQKDIWDKIDSTINQGISSGAITPSYSIEQKGSGMSLNDWAAPMNATPTDTYLKNQASRYRFNDSSIDQYIQKANPELFKQYKILNNSNDTTGASMYMEQAYKNAQSRLGSQYQDDFYGSLKTQFKDLQGMLMTPDQKMGSDRQAIMDNQGLNPDVKEAILKGMEPKDPWSDLMAKYGPKTAPADDMATAYSMNPNVQSWEVEQQQAKQKAIEDQKKGLIDPATVTFFESNNPGKTVEMVDGVMTLVPKKAAVTQPASTVDSAKPAQTNVPTAVTPTTAEYAQEMVTPTNMIATTGAPEPASTAMASTFPWSKEFETSLLAQVGGFKSSLDDYIKILSNPTVSTGNINSNSQPSFGLSKLYGDTNQMNSGIVSSTPQPFGSNIKNPTASPFTGKAGQVGLTTTGQQSLWR
jgi:hypothetical protein